MPTEAGFSLVELLVVLALLALASGLFVNQIGGGGVRVSQRHAAISTIAALAEARRTAMRSGRAHWVEILPDGGVRTSGNRAGGRRSDGSWIEFRPDGGSSGGMMRIGRGKGAIWLVIDPFIGVARIAGGRDG